MSYNSTLITAGLIVAAGVGVASVAPVGGSITAAFGYAWGLLSTLSINLQLIREAKAAGTPLPNVRSWAWSYAGCAALAAAAVTAGLIEVIK